MDEAEALLIIRQKEEFWSKRCTFFPIDLQTFVSIVNATKKKLKREPRSLAFQLRAESLDNQTDKFIQFDSSFQVFACSY